MFFRDIRSKTVCKKGVVKSFAKFTGKQLCWSLFSIISGSMQRGLQLYCDSVTCTLTLARVFSCESCEIFKNNFFLKEHLQWLLLTVFLILSLVHLFISVLSYVCFSLNVSGTFIFIQQCSMENGMKKIKKLLKTLKNTLKYTYTGKKNKKKEKKKKTKKNPDKLTYQENFLFNSVQSMDQFLYDNGLRHERIKKRFKLRPQIRCTTINKLLI